MSPNPALSSVAALKTCTSPVPGNKCLYHGPNYWIKFNFSGFLVGQGPYIGHFKFTWYKMLWDMSPLVNQTQHDNDVTEMHFGNSERELELRGNLLLVGLPCQANDIWNHRIMNCSVFGGYIYIKWDYTLPLTQCRLGQVPGPQVPVMHTVSSDNGWMDGLSVYIVFNTHLNPWSYRINTDYIPRFSCEFLKNDNIAIKWMSSKKACSILHIFLTVC